MDLGVPIIIRITVSMQHSNTFDIVNDWMLLVALKQFYNVIITLFGCVHCPDKVQMLPPIDDNVFHKIFNLWN